MKTRILSFILVAVMIFTALPAAVSASDLFYQIPELDSLIKIAKAAPSSEGRYYVYVNEFVNVSKDTDIPADVTVVMYSEGMLNITAKLRVYGSIDGGTTSNIIIGKGGSVEYKSPVIWDSYDPKYPYTIYPYYGAYCSNCGSNNVRWCTYCNAYHCAKCGSHINVDSHYCSVHKTNMTYCTMCGQYYCKACVGGTHGRTANSDKCIIVPLVDNTTTCNIHGTAKYYCAICGKYYCPTCEGGVHVRGANGKCYIYNAATSSTCYIHGANKLYCSICGKYYCPTCEGGYHVANPYNPRVCMISQTSNNYYCATHKTNKVYCSHCNTYYCPTCSGGYHVYDSYYGYCRVVPNTNNGGTVVPNLGAYQYYDIEYVYVPNQGYVITSMACLKPTASISSGVVNAGSAVTFTCLTPNTVIRYTTDGSIPNSGSPVYSSPIVINKSMTIRAAAFHSAVTQSTVVSYNYTVKSSTTTNPTDISGYPGLVDSVNVLINAGLMINTTKVNPSGSVSWSDLKDYFTDMGLKITKSRVDDDFFADANKITYEEFVLATYKILRANDLIRTARGGSAVLDKLKYRNEITNKAVYKAAYISIIENNVLYSYNFHPQNEANRANLITMLAWTYNKVK